MKFKQFIKEESPIMDPKYSKEFESLGAKIKYKDRYKELFKEGDRVYLPVKGELKVDLRDFDIDIMDAIEKRSRELESKVGFEIFAMESFEKDKIIFKNYNHGYNKKYDEIKNNYKFIYTYEELIKEYGSEAEKRMLSSIPKVGNHDKLMVMISRNPCDIGSMSTGTHWTSCMNLYNGMYNTYTREDVKFGTLIAYLIDSDDKDAKKPLGRKLIKPYINYGEKLRKELLVLTKPTYGMFTDKAEKVIKEWLNKHQKDIEGYFKLHSSLYADDDIRTIKKVKYHKDKINEIQTILK